MAVTRFLAVTVLLAMSVMRADCQIQQRLCQDGQSFAVRVPPELMLYSNDVEEIVCFDVRLKTKGVPLTYINDSLTEHACRVSNALSSVLNKDDIPMPWQTFLLTTSDIAKKKGFDERGNYVVIEQRLFIKKGKMYCKIPKNFSPVYEFVYKPFTSFYKQPSVKLNRDDAAPPTTTLSSTTLSPADNESTIYKDDSIVTKATLSLRNPSPVGTTKKQYGFIDNHVKFVTVKTVNEAGENLDKSETNFNFTVQQIVGISLVVLLIAIMIGITIHVGCKKRKYGGEYSIVSRI